MSETFVIAEIGVNHNGELQKALDLIDIASEAGAVRSKEPIFVSSTPVTNHRELLPDTNSHLVAFGNRS